MIASGQEGYTGRFPDIINTKKGLLAAYYWNDTHAPYVFGDHLGTIRIQKGTPDGEKWASPVELINEEFLVKSGLGLWKSGDTYYYSKTDADANNADFCIEARDPNFARMGDRLVMTFFTRVPWNSEQCGHSFFQYNENYAYTYGRTYIIISNDEGNTWSQATEIKTEYLDRGAAKRGNIAVINDHTLLIPLYGYNSNLENAFTTTNVLAVFKDGVWVFQEEYYSHAEEGVEVPGAFKRELQRFLLQPLTMKYMLFLGGRAMLWSAKIKA